MQLRMFYANWVKKKKFMQFCFASIILIMFYCKIKQYLFIKKK